jgi:hypothetical protein
MFVFSPCHATPLTVLIGCLVRDQDEPFSGLYFTQLLPSSRHLWYDTTSRVFSVNLIIPAVQHATDGSETRTCIDGKQRLTSIQR